MSQYLPRQTRSHFCLVCLNPINNNNNNNNDDMFTSKMSALVLLSSGSLNSVYLINMEFMFDEAYW